MLYVPIATAEALLRTFLVPTADTSIETFVEFVHVHPRKELIWSLVFLRLLVNF